MDQKIVKASILAIVIFFGMLFLNHQITNSRKARVADLKSSIQKSKQIKLSFGELYFQPGRFGFFSIVGVDELTKIKYRVIISQMMQITTLRDLQVNYYEYNDRKCVLKIVNNGQVLFENVPTDNVIESTPYSLCEIPLEQMEGN